MKLQEQVKMLDEIIGFGADLSLFIPGIFFALEDLSSDFSDLLCHARSSLPYDPVMQKWITDASEETLVSTSEESEDEDDREALTTEEEPAPPVH